MANTLFESRASWIGELCLIIFAVTIKPSITQATCGALLSRNLVHVHAGIFSSTTASEGPGIPLINSTDVWCSKKVNNKQSLTVDLGVMANISKVAIGGKKGTIRSVSQFFIFTSTDGTSYSAIRDDHNSFNAFDGSLEDGDLVAESDLPSGTEARYVRFNPREPLISKPNHLCLRVEIYGCVLIRKGPRGYDDEPCKNGGTYIKVKGDNKFKCFCPHGFKGKFCDKGAKDCNGEPCKNGGICVKKKGDNKFRCFCPPGFKGKFCEKGLKECNGEPCKNGGICVKKKGDNKFRCFCPPGFKGRFCEKGCLGSRPFTTASSDKLVTANENNLKADAKFWVAPFAVFVILFLVFFALGVTICVRRRRKTMREATALRDGSGTESSGNEYESVLLFGPGGKFTGFREHKPVHEPIIKPTALHDGNISNKGAGTGSNGNEYETVFLSGPEGQFDAPCSNHNSAETESSDNHYETVILDFDHLERKLIAPRDPIIKPDSGKTSVFKTKDPSGIELGRSFNSGPSFEGPSGSGPNDETYDDGFLFQPDRKLLDSLADKT